MKITITETESGWRIGRQLVVDVDISHEDALKLVRDQRAVIVLPERFRVQSGHNASPKVHQN